MVTDVQEQVSLPQGSNQVAKAIADLSMQLIADHKAAGGNLAVELSEDAIALVKDLQAGLGGAASIKDEVAAEPIGVAEAFALAGFSVARSLTGK